MAPLQRKTMPGLCLATVIAAALGLLAMVPGPLEATPPAGYTLGWSDEFNGAVGSGPNPANWNFDTGNSGFGNAELETYVTDTAHCSIISDPNATDGLALQITATDNNGGVGTAGIYNSARIYTGAKVGIQYGYIEIRAKAPQGGPGIWPAFWMLGGDSQTLGWPGCGEQDILEQFGNPLSNSTSWHMSLYGTEADWSGQYSLPGGASYSNGYHKYAILWSQPYLAAYIDDTLFEWHYNASSPGWIFNHPFYFLLNLSVGGGPPGNPTAATVFPQNFDIDYIRVYNGPQTNSPGSGTIVDTCDSFVNVYNTSGNWVIDNSNPTYFNGDAGRISRVVNTTQFVNYKYTNVKSMSAVIGTNTTDNSSVTIWYSSDHGNTYTQAATSSTAITPTTAGWGLYTVSTSGTLPAGVTDVKLQETPTVNAWDHQICQVTITSDPEPVPPLTPTSIVCTPGNGQNTLSWLSASNATSYDVYRTTTPYAEAAPPVASGITGTSYVDGGLTNGTTYYYAISAVDASGTSPLSVQAQGAPTGTGPTCSASPSAPGGLAASVTTSTGTTLNWNAVTAPANCSISTYVVYENGTSIGTTGATTFAVTGLKASTAYTFTVAATDGFGTGPQSGAVNVTTTSGSSSEGPFGGTPAAIPGTVQAENYDTGGQGIAYNVTAVNGTANSYRTDGVDIEATTDTGGGDNLGWTGAGQWFKYTVNVATAGTYTVGLRLAAPTAVTGGLHISNASGTNLSGAVNVPATGGWQTWTTVNATVTLPAGQQILTVNQDAAGWNINYLTFAAAGPPLPGAPTLQTPTAGNTVVTLNWTAGSNAASYNIYRGTSAGGESATAVGTSNGTSFTNSGLTNNTKYYFTVKSVNATGTSAASNEVSATPVASSSEGPFGGTPAAVPGTVQAENYDTGGQGVAYNITAVNGTANSYRTDGVDIEATTDTGGGDNIGWTGAGQWFKYTVNVATAGTYTVGLRLAAPAAVAGALHLSNSSGTNLSGAISVPATGAYQTWTTVNATVTLPAGQQTLTINQDAAGWNINYLTFTLMNAPVISINCGGAAAAPFVADTDFTGGTAVSVTNTIDTSLLTGTIPPQAVLQSNRYNAPTYTIGGLTAGSQHTVTLYFAEGYWTATGKRLFNVSINGTSELTNFDIFATAGAEFKAVQKTFTVSANSSGQIVITTTNVTDNAQINGISVL